MIARPYLLYEVAHDSEVEAVSYLRELVALEEGSVSDADLMPRAAP